MIVFNKIVVFVEKIWESGKTIKKLISLDKFNEKC